MGTEEKNEPVNEAELVNRLDRQHTLSHVKPRHVLREGIVLDEHRHQVASGKELHEEVEVVGVLERVVELDDPRRVGLGEDVSLSADVGEL
jgi:hypothetical protein